MSGVIELSIGSVVVSAGRRSVDGSAAADARLGVADRVDDGVDRVLEPVAVGRDDPGVRRPAGAARPRGSSRARRAAAGRRGSPRPPAPLGSRPRSSARRRARSSTDASRKILRSASGRTTVPMSRPAMTIPPRRRQVPAADRAGRGASSGIAETAETAASTCGPRTSSVWSTPSTRTGASRPSSSGASSTSSTRPRIACGYDAATRGPSASQVTARYSRPVSQNR